MNVRKKSILIVEDDPAIALGLQELFLGEGFHVTHVDNGNEAIHIIERSAPEIVVLDVGLPGMNGFAVCRRLRESSFMGAILLLTARVESLDKVIGFEAGADDYVTKPFDPRELVARVNAHARRITRSGDTRHAGNYAPDGYDRHLRVIMFTDIVGYSKSMHENERRAMHVLAFHNEKMDALIMRHNGRVVEIIGDAFLVLFESALHAVECAAHTLRYFRCTNRLKPISERIHLRIGIHLGDIFERADDIKGDTINVAARLQTLADPDAVIVSESVYHATAQASHITMHSLGLKNLKNIPRPIQVYHLSY